MGTLQIAQGPELCHQILCKGAAATLSETMQAWAFILLGFYLPDFKGEEGADASSMSCFKA